MAKSVNRRLAFIGAPGSGKTTLAAQYAARYGLSVIDTDEVFTRRYGDISAYFLLFGEQSFRNIEREIVSDAVNSSADIIACGGGVVLDRRNVNALRAHCDIVRLNAPITVLRERIKNSSRPLASRLDEIVAEREKLYTGYADYTVDTENNAIERLETALSLPRKNRYDVLLCDADDTLLDFKKAMKRSVLTAARAVGVKSNDDKIVDEYARITKTVWEKLERREVTRKQLNEMRFAMLKDALDEDFDSDAMNEAYINAMIGTTDVIDGAIDFLSEIKARKIGIYVITNSFTRIARHRLNILSDYIDGAFISEEIGFDKPDKRFFDAVLCDIGSPDKDRVLIFGDGESSDIKGGIASGIDTCLFDTSAQKRTDADFSVATYKEVANIL